MSTSLTTGKPDTVARTSVAYDSMAESWPLIHDIVGGTRVMQKAGRKWLQQEDAESDEAYQRRLERTILYEAFRATIDNMVDKPFGRDVTVKNSDKLPKEVQEILKDVDLQGTSITSFAKECLRDLILHGITHILVDAPQVARPEQLNAYTERQQKIRPYFCRVTAPALIAFPSSHIRGVQVPTSIRVKETRIEKDPATTWGDREVEYIRIIHFNLGEDIPPLPAEQLEVYAQTAPTDKPLDVQGSWELWRKNPNAKLEHSAEWSRVSTGTYLYKGLPMVTVYLDRTGFMTARSPMEPLAYQCLRHWQSGSDQINVLHVARFAQLFIKGVAENDFKRVEVGPLRAIRTSNPEADAKYLDPGGEAVNAGFKDMEQIEERMEVLGNEIAMRRTGAIVATSRAISEVKEQAAIQSWLRALEMAIDDAIRTAGRHYDENFELPEDVRTNIFSEFSLTSRSKDDAAVLDKARDRMDIPLDTYLTELKRRDILSPDTDVEDMVKRAEEEKEKKQEHELKLKEKQAEAAPGEDPRHRPGGDKGGEDPLSSRDISRGITP